MSVVVPIWEKYTLTVDEAAQYFRIGEARLRRLISDHPNAEYLIYNGNRAQIIRKLFEKFIDSTSTI